MGMQPERQFELNDALDLRGWRLWVWNRVNQLLCWYYSYLPEQQLDLVGEDWWEHIRKLRLKMVEDRSKVQEQLWQKGA